MTSIEQRLQRLAQILGTQRPLCPICRNALITIVIYDDLDGGPLRIVGLSCKACGSPDAFQFHVIYDDEVPTNPAKGVAEGRLR